MRQEALWECSHSIGRRGLNITEAPVFHLGPVIGGGFSLVFSGCSSGSLRPICLWVGGGGGGVMTAEGPVDSHLKPRWEVSGLQDSEVDGGLSAFTGPEH